MGVLELQKSAVIIKKEKSFYTANTLPSKFQKVSTAFRPVLQDSSFLSEVTTTDDTANPPYTSDSSSSNFHAYGEGLHPLNDLIGDFSLLENKSWVSKKEQQRNTTWLLTCKFRL